MVARHEGFRANAYRCPAGVWTIGYGTTRWGDGQPVREGDGPIEQSAARRLLMNDLRWAADAVRDLVTVELSEHQQAALISFVYNVGRKAFSGSTLLGRLNAGDYNGAAGQFARWNKGGGNVLPGLMTRRAEEAALFSGKAIKGQP
jgi:GH24 family phage-related lysozyme (muramidase)